MAAKRGASARLEKGNDMTNWIEGIKLSEHDRREVLAAYVHRYTGEHVPQWARAPWNTCKVQFATDAEWLANTRFAVRKDGRLHQRIRHCMSNPTWPKAEVAQ